MPLVCRRRRVSKVRSHLMLGSCSNAAVSPPGRRRCRIAARAHKARGDGVSGCVDQHTRRTAREPTKRAEYAGRYLRTNKAVRSPTACRTRACQLPGVSSLLVVRSLVGLDMNIPAAHPCIISSLPCLLEVMKMTSALKLFQVSLRSWTVSGRPPRFFESQRIMRSGSMCLWIRPVIVVPNVRS